MNANLNKAYVVLAACQDWTNTARLLSEKEHNRAQYLEWQAMKEVACLETRLVDTSTMRKM